MLKTINGKNVRGDFCKPSRGRWTVVNGLTRWAAFIAGLSQAATVIPSTVFAEDASAEVQSPRPSIVFIMADTFRADRMGCLGGGELTPTLDSLAAEGVVFEQAISSAPWTLPSIASLFCGYYPSVHGMNQYGEMVGLSRTAVGNVVQLDDDFVTLAERLREGGYETAGFSANPFIIPELGFDQGFDHFEALYAEETVNGATINAAALRWLAGRQSRQAPFFLYLHYMDTHGPYYADLRFLDPLLDEVMASPGTPMTDSQFAAMKSYLQKPPKDESEWPRYEALKLFPSYWVARYEAGVRQMDSYLADLFSSLQKEGLWAETYVIFASDHGEALFEHGLWDHGFSLHQDQIHVPLILRCPGLFPSGKRVPQTVRLFDVTPTLLAGLQLPPLNGIDAASLIGLIEGTSQQIGSALAESVKKSPRRKAFIVGDWKLMGTPHADQFELYNLTTDPKELANVQQSNQSQINRLGSALERQLEKNRRTAERLGITAHPGADESTSP